MPKSRAHFRKIVPGGLLLATGHDEVDRYYLSILIGSALVVRRIELGRHKGSAQLQQYSHRTPARQSSAYVSGNTSLICQLLSKNKADGIGAHNLKTRRLR
jgi:hypothetical protein